MNIPQSAIITATVAVVSVYILLPVVAAGLAIWWIAQHVSW